jgi:hypothetical protein
LRSPSFLPQVYRCLSSLQSLCGSKSPYQIAQRVFLGQICLSPNHSVQIGEKMFKLINPIPLPLAEPTLSGLPIILTEFDFVSVRVPLPPSSSLFCRSPLFYPPAQLAVDRSPSLRRNRARRRFAKIELPVADTTVVLGSPT